jgi:TMEM175 potassium channel family protein
VNATYIPLIWELVTAAVPPKARRIMRVRSIVTLCLFGAAAIVALRYPSAGLATGVCCLVVYLKPEAPGAEARVPHSR